MREKDAGKGNGRGPEPAEAGVAEESRADRPEQPAEEAGRGSRKSGGGAEGLEAPTVENLEKALAEADEEISALREEALRAQAELENFRKRAQRDLETGLKFALERFIAELLPVLDSLEMGLAAAQDASGDPASEKLLEGTALTLKQFLQILEKHGVQQVDPGGERFDPELHEAVTLQPSGEHEPNTVTTVIQKGYRLHERLIRPALVVVAKEPEGGKPS